MPSKSTKAPGFRSESEEADWYASPEGRRHTEREFVRALKAGTLVRASRAKVTKTDPTFLEKLMEQAKQTATRPISLRVPIADIERAKQIAENTGVGYQTVLKAAIHKGLRKAG